MNTHSLVRPASRVDLAALLDELRELLAREFADCGVEHEAVLVTEEVLVNALEHGNVESARDPRLEVHVWREGHRLHLRLRDTGRPHDPFSAEAPEVGKDLDDRPVGGLGVFLVVELSAETAYRREEPCNVVDITLDCAPERP